MSKNEPMIIKIRPDGKVEIDQVGWTGATCSSDCHGFIEALGRDTKVTNKPEYYRDNEVHIKECG